MMNPVTYLKQVGQEIKLVTWPTRQQTQRKTLIVLGVSLLLALYVGLIDLVLQRLIAFVLT